jgi:hypothetical protein
MGEISLGEGIQHEGAKALAWTVVLHAETQA